MTIQQLFDFMITKNASDLHLLSDFPPVIRVNGELSALAGVNKLTQEDIEQLVYPLLLSHQKELFLQNWELDFGLDFEHRARFRVNLYKQRGNFAAAFRLIPRTIRTLEETGLPNVVSKLTDLRRGLVLVTGPTGHGKTTTLAAFLNQINQTRSSHIITIEDPIEFTYPQSRSLISQRELNSDTKSWPNALKAALREDPDVVLIGEMRDLDTMQAAMTIAETGHLVFATLHTNSAAQTIDRIIDVFPYNQQAQVRMQLSAVLEAVIAQRLVPTIEPGRALAYELMFGTEAIRSVIRDAKTHMVDNIIQTSAEYGMVSLESSLASLVRQGRITAEVANTFAARPSTLAKLLERAPLR